MGKTTRFNVLGVGVHALTFAPAVQEIIDRARGGPTGYVCFCDVNGISWAHRDPTHRARLKQAWRVTPDGMPIVWLAHRQGHKEVQRVYGPDVLRAVCAAPSGKGLTHYFYGGAPGVAAELASRLQSLNTDLVVAGTDAPPYRPLHAEEKANLAERLNTLRPDFIWVGLGTPKQEQFMAELAPLLDRGVLLGVGAAFDFLTDRVPQAPRWMQRAGLEWLHRLFSEPRRLGPRYLRNIPLFIFRLLLQALRLRRYPMD